MFHEKNYSAYRTFGKTVGFFSGLLIFCSMGFFIFLRKKQVISYLDFIGIVIALYLIGLLVKKVVGKNHAKQDVAV